jgi:hypothetical protein
MSAARNRAPDVNAIERKLAAEHPELSSEQRWNKAYAEHVVQMRAHTTETLKVMMADPAAEKAIRLQRAQQEARRNLPPEPKLAEVQDRERAKIMREEGLTREEATVRAIAKGREEERLWNRSMLEEVNVLLARDADRPVTLVAPRTVAKKAAPAVEHFVPVGMTRGEARDAAERGHLPVRAIRSADATRHVRLMDRVRTIQAKGTPDYTAAYIAATNELAAEDAETVQAAEGIEASRVTARAAQLLHLGKHFSDFAHCRTEEGATATARAQLAAEDAEKAAAT